jgi:hypothetical protein
MFNRLVIFVFLMFAFFAARGGVSAADNKVESYSLLDSLDISLESDSYYNTGVENLTTETGLVFGFRDFTFDITPTVTSDDMLTDLKFGLQYDWKLTDNIVIAPYSEVHYDDDFGAGDRVIGIKTTIKLF